MVVPSTYHRIAALLLAVGSLLITLWRVLPLTTLIAQVLALSVPLSLIWFPEIWEAIHMAAPRWHNHRASPPSLLVILGWLLLVGVTAFFWAAPRVNFAFSLASDYN